MKNVDLSDVTFIFPIRINSTEKLENLNIVTEYILTEFETHIIVLEADVEELAALKPEVKKIFIFDSNPVFFKSKYLNLLTGLVKTPFIGIWNENILINRKQICESINLLRANSTDIVFPYNGNISYTPSMFRELYVKRKSLDVFFYNIDRFLTLNGQFTVDGAVFLRRDSYIEAGMENENLFGWNIGSLERLKKIEILGYNVKWLKGHAFHLHQIRELNSWQRGNKLKILQMKEYLDVCKMNKSELINLLNDKSNNLSPLFLQNDIKAPHLPVIQSLWIGTELSEMERLSISSFLHNGHDFHLYIYNDIKDIPKGTTLMDANRIIPADKIFKYKDFDSYAGFSNIFRYKLLLEKGGYWVDSDIICLKPFLHNTEYIFASERPWYPKYKDEIIAASCLIKVPANSGIMQYCYNESINKKTDELKWGQIGPQLLTNAIEKFNLWHYVANPEVFCPVDVRDWNKIISGALSMDTLMGSHAVHLWNEMWRRNRINKSANYCENSIYEQLKKLYLNNSIST